MIEVIVLTLLAVFAAYMIFYVPQEDLDDRK